eukprot:TRINITY_DN9433_c0_g1_i4.p2 TRINITY_DN9433_c0_g1~~TRINITY_DN9433_c0_g1_i4.p2  ORF type:complete len:251 (+),score=41.42 TRINITY_DN9433_c0_g1_i4:2617-3369(+)
MSTIKSEDVKKRGTGLTSKSENSTADHIPKSKTATNSTSHTTTPDQNDKQKTPPQNKDPFLLSLILVRGILWLGLTCVIYLLVYLTMLQATQILLETTLCQRKPTQISFTYELFAFSVQALLAIPYVRLLRVTADGQWKWTLAATALASLNAVVTGALVYGFIYVSRNMRTLAETFDCRYIGYPSWAMCTLIMFACIKFHRNQATAWKICTLIHVMTEVAVRVYFMSLEEVYSESSQLRASICIRFIFIT